MTENEKQFGDLKCEYSQKDTNENRKKELISLMQQNLKGRTGEDSWIIKCIDGKEYSLNSNNVEDLYAIDGTLKNNASQQRLTEVADDTRKAQSDSNKYGSNNPYPTR